MTDTPSPAEPAPAKEPRPPGSTLAFALLAYIAGNTVYGLPMLLFPGLIWGTIAGAEAEERAALESTRWVGALLLALAIGALLLLVRKPTGQRTFVTTLALGDAAMAAALLLGAVSGDFDGIVDVWFVWATALGLAAISGYLWWARFKARALLHI